MLYRNSAGILLYISSSYLIFTCRNSAKGLQTTITLTAIRYQPVTILYKLIQFRLHRYFYYIIIFSQQSCSFHLFVVSYLTIAVRQGPLEPCDRPLAQLTRFCRERSIYYSGADCSPGCHLKGSKQRNTPPLPSSTPSKRTRRFRAKEFIMIL